MKNFVLEFLGSFLYLFIGCLAEILIINYFPINNFIIELFLVSFIFAVSFSGCYILLGKRTSIDINPIFTFVLWLRNQISLKKLFTSIAAQFLGALATGCILFLLFQENVSTLALGYGELSAFNISLDGVILIELLFSFIFAFCFLYFHDKKIPPKFSGIFLGGIFFLLLFFSIPYTGGCVNLSRSLVVNLFVNSNSLRQIWIYVLSSLAGAVLATIIYHIFYQIKNKVLSQHFL